MRPSLHIGRTASGFAAAAAAALALVSPPAIANGFTLKALHVFCTQGDCSVGPAPLSGLVRDKSGTLYGAAYNEGKFGYGFVYALTPKSGKYQYRTIYDFCLHTECVDGANPAGDLIEDTAGNLYGTTVIGGTPGRGVVYKLSSRKRGWSNTVLYAFCTQANCTDGGNPRTSLSYAGQAEGKLWDQTSPLFGTASSGGANGHGVIFELKHNGSQWSYTVIHDLINGDGPNPVLVGPNGNLYVTSYTGGAHGFGNFYSLDKGTWKQHVIHIFCSENSCTDGGQPLGTLAIDSHGNVFGTAISGGAFANGVAFEHPAGGGYKVIYDFCNLSGCVDGKEPAGLSPGADADSFYGVAGGGGANGGGAVFSLKFKHGSWAESVLKSFCPNGDCKSGAFPDTTLVQDSLGDIFGAASAGGFIGPCGVGNGCGTVFELKH